MSIPLICACGARLQLDDAMGGQEVICPECQERLKAPTVQTPPLRTSMLALASVILALTGAVTVVGSSLAVVIGLAALGHIARHRDRLAGVGLAIFGIVAGALFTALTIFALTSGRLEALGNDLREGMLKDQVDTSGPLTVRRQSSGFAITRSSTKWGLSSHEEIRDPIVQALDNKCDFLMLETAHYAFVDVKHQPRAGDNLSACVREALYEFDSRDQRGLFRGDELPRTLVRQLASQSLPPPLNEEGEELIQVKGYETLVMVTCGRQTWRFLLRFYLTPTGTLYTLRGYAREGRFSQAEREIRQVLDSFRLFSGI